jgi:release factor glutamine methyltransferase
VTFYEAAVRARGRLVEAGIRPETAALDVDLLARHALGWDLATWLAHRHEMAPAEFARRYESLIERRVRREPVAYIRGVQEFWGREFRVSPEVLIPRAETELLIELAAEHLRHNPQATVVDVGTGSGCIAITLALEHPQAVMYAVDISEAALVVARENAQRLGATRVQFSRSSLLSGAPRPIDVVISNPPYVAERDKPGLAREVRDHEPAVALFGGEDGWRDIRSLLRQAAERLAKNGVLLMELGFGQWEHLSLEVAGAGLVLEDIAPDLQGIPRAARIRPG